MKYIVAPNDVNIGFREFNRGIFLAGGISGCGDWQAEMVEKLKDSDLTIFNPRRQIFSNKDTEYSEEQIKWEYHYLSLSTEILFWFTPPTLNPIVLFEMGVWSRSNKKLYVGIHPDYERKSDVEIQMKFARPDVKIVYTLDDLATQVLS